MYRTAISLCIFAALGCGGNSKTPELGSVSGVVTVDGEPKANVLVTFQPKDGRPSSATTNESGEYKLQYTASESGAKIGKHLVTISSQPPASEDESCSCGDDSVFLDPIHPKYNTQAAKNPDMTREVKPGKNTFNFDVETDTSARTKSGPSKRQSRTCE